MADQAALAAFIQWANAIKVASKPVKHAADLSNGIVLFEICHDIDAKRFKLLQSTDMGDNWVLKVNNLKKLYRLIMVYYEEVLDQPLQRLGSVNLNAIAREANAPELVRLCKLVLLMAVQSTKNVKYVQPIESLPPDTQVSMMRMVESITERLNGADTTDSAHGAATTAAEPDGEHSLTSGHQEQRLLALEAELSRLFAEKQEADRQVQRLTEDNADYVTRYEELMVDNQDVHSKLKDAERALARVDQSGKADFLLKTEIDHLKQDLEKAEARSHAAESLVNEQTQAITDLNRRLEDSAATASEAARLRDQLQEYRHAAEKLQKTEHVIEKYKKKLEDSADLRRQFKHLEEQNTQLVARNQALEDEYRKVSQFKPLMDTYKDQIATLESKHNLANLKNSDLEHELKQTRDRLSALEQERQENHEQITSLEDNLRELELTGLSMAEVPSSPVAATSLGNALAEGNVFELKAKVARLENDLRNARRSREGADPSQKVVLLENLLDDAQRSKAKFEADYLKAHQRILVLEAELKQPRSADGNGGRDDLTLDLRTRLNDSAEELSQLRARLAETEVQLEQVTKELTVARSDLNMVNQDQRQALDSLKLQSGADLAALKQEHELLQSWYNDLEAGAKDKEARISRLLTEKDQLQQESIQNKDLLLEKERANSELKEALINLRGKDQGEEVEFLKAQLVDLHQDKSRMQQEILQYEIRTKKLRTLIANQEEALKESKGRPQESDYTEAIGSLKQALQSKARELDTLKHEFTTHVQTANREYRHLLSAWYNAGNQIFQLQQRAARTPHTPSSWMAHQRNGLSIKLQRQ
ncbi:hypothetical protein IWQ60_011247 [Tieghemiomyces parasiticus]|uniref:Uncharacterized protein n=1 Tax=Tieghemiomyces parasiticus TaxID=78921 RepID=A0A9W8DIM6_9FUNG|nr:hypothetical protein IWQ60_011247 [Tieghemiomyces parasiticus]